MRNVLVQYCETKNIEFNLDNLLYGLVEQSSELNAEFFCAVHDFIESTNRF